MQKPELGGFRVHGSGDMGTGSEDRTGEGHGGRAQGEAMLLLCNFVLVKT